MKRLLRIVFWPLRAVTYLVGCFGGAGFVLASLMVVALWLLGTRGAPLTVRLAERLLPAQLQVAEVSGGLFGPMVLNGVVLNTPAARVEVDHLALDWMPSALWIRRLHISRVEIGDMQVHLHATPPSEPQPLTPRLPLSLVLDAVTVRHVELWPVQGAAQHIDAIHARASWKGDVIQLDELALSLPQTGPLTAQGSATLAARSITLHDVQVKGPGRLVADGTVGLLGAPSHLRAEWQDGRWPLTGAAPQLRAPHLQATAEGVLAGAPLQLALTLRGALRTAVADKSLGFDLDSAVQLHHDHALIERLQLSSTDGAGLLTAEGRAQWQPTLRVDAEADVRRLDPGVLLPDWKGQLNGHLTAQTAGSAAAPQVQFRAQLQDSRLRGYPLRLEMQGSAAMHTDVRQLRIDNLQLQSGNARLQAQGTVLPALDASASLDASDLQAVLPGLSGSTQLRASARGPLTAPAVQLQGTLKDLHMQQLQLASARLDMNVDPARVSQVRIDLAELKSGKTMLAQAHLEANGRIDQHTVQLQAVLAKPHAQARVVLDGRFNLVNRSWQGQLRDSTLTPPIGPVWQQEHSTSLMVSAVQQSLAPTCWHASPARVCFELGSKPPQTRLAYRIEHLDTAAFAAALPKNWNLQTVVEGSGLVVLNGSEPQTVELDLATGAGQLGLPNAPSLKLLPGTLIAHRIDGRWQARAQLAVEQGRLELLAEVPDTGGAFLLRPLSGELRLQVPDLRWMTPLVPGVQDLRGRIDGQFSLAGSLSEPRFHGGLTLADASAKVNAAGIQIKEMQASVQGDESGALQLQASARSGTGTLHLAGTADFAGGSPQLQLTIQGEQVQVADLADARVWVSPDLRYQQGPDGMQLNGTVLVPKADITPRQLAENAIGASGDQVLVGRDAPEKPKSLPLTASVTIVLGDAVSFEGFGLKSKVAGSVTAFDSPGSGGTRGEGELRLVDAVYKAYGQEIHVETGRILFNGGLITQPAVDLVASRKPRDDVTVSLHVRGTLDQPAFDLSSSPVMPREQQLGWLLFGKPLDSGAGGQFSGAAAALSLGIAGGDALASRIGSVIGLDQISLAADPSSTAWQPTTPYGSNQPSAAGTEQTRFTVGKYLSPRLFVSYGVGLFQNGNVLRLLYDLGHGFKLRTESGLETSGDLLYSVEH